ncbi:hypothetical protein BOX15_Mlig004050g2, partial [Macrostomum lignano]
ASPLVLSEPERQQAVENFRAYLRINTMHPRPDCGSAVAWLRGQAAELGLDSECIECHPGQPVLIMRWPGSEPNRTSLLLNSHMDVVPVFPEHWRCDPFSADMDEQGNIYARGAQDMKCVAVQYLEALRKLKAANYQPKRNIYLSFMPDEEVTGKLGMGKFCQSDKFRSLNVGCAMDEGLANPTEAFTVYYGERSVWWLRFEIRGQPGHGSRLMEDTAGEKAAKLIQRLYRFRDSQVERLERGRGIRLGEVTTLNLTQMNGGVQTNVLPEKLCLDVDCRIAPDVNLVHFEAELRRWCEEAGPGVSLEFTQKFDAGKPTDTSERNPWWSAFAGSCQRLGMNIEPEIFPAATDSRYLRSLGISAIGFSPMNRTPVLLHDHNEFLNRDVFLRGVELYTTIIPDVADCPAA